MDTGDSEVQHIVHTDENHEDMDRSFTLRALFSGLFIGVLVNLSNTYYGLRIGAGSQMSMVSGLLGYVGFKLFSRYTAIRFTAAENVLLISVATATGCMPLTAGSIGVIPALEYLIGPEENGPLRIHWENLVFWSMGLCFFGLIFASLLREHFIVREKLPWPGPRATAHLINTLHYRSSKSPTISRGSLSSNVGVEATRAECNGCTVEEQQPLLAQGNDIEWKLRMGSLLQGAIASGIITIFLYFVPIFRGLPIFGYQAASKWFWTADLSPGFLGQGIITGPAIPLHMLIGSVVGCGILSPYAKHRGWAPGDVDDWATGSRGWIIWVSLAALLADASVKLTWFLLRPFWRAYLDSRDLQNQLMAFSSTNDRSQGPQPLEGQYLAVRFETHDDSEATQSHLTQRTGRSSNRCSPPQEESNRSFEGPLTLRILEFGFLVSIIICTLAIYFIFGNIIPWYYTVLATALSLPMAVVGIRSLAETDYNPESALVSQLVFATLISHSNPNAIIINLLSAAVAQAGANQAGDISFDFKIGSLVGARPEAQIYGQIIGSLFGALISCGIYKLYASQYTIPGPLFRIPSSFLVLSTARLVMGRGLPEGVAPFALGATITSMIVTIIKMRYATRWWQKLIPSGVSFAIGIYNMPSFTIARALGGIFYWVYKRRNKGREGNIIVLASGLVLGESVASLVSVALIAMHAPQLGTK